MKKLVILFLLGIICTGCSQTKKSFWDTKDAYYGQKPPEIIPELFAPSIINHFAHYSPSFTPDGKYLFFTQWNSTPYYHDIYWVSSSILEDYKEKGKK